MNIQRNFSNGNSYYDAASTVDRERDWGYLWGAESEDYRFDSYARATVIGRARRERRNNPFLDGYINGFASEMGTSRLRSRTGINDFDRAKEQWWYDRVALRAAWGGLTLRELEKVIWNELFLAGEVFLIMLKDGRVRVVRSELCGATPVVKPLPNERNGIVYDPNGEPIAYRFGKMNANGLIDFSDTTVISADYVIHILDRDCADMGRGIPWVTSSLTAARDIWELFRSKVTQIKAANKVFGIRHKKSLEDDLVQGAEFDDEPEDEDSPADKAPTVAVTDQGVELRNGMLITLEEEGEDIKLLEAKYHTTDHVEMITHMLCTISAPRGLPVEKWYNGIGNASFSGSKAINMLWASRRKDNHQMIEDKFFGRYQFWRSSKASKAGEIPESPFRGAHRLVSYGWTNTSNVDDEKEAKAAKVRIESGQSDLETELELRGDFIDEAFVRRAKIWKQMEEARGGDRNSIPPRSFMLRGALPEDEESDSQVDPKEEDEDEQETTVPAE